jgi:hypothetical protein
MLNRDRLINIGMWSGGIIAFILLALMVGPAIKFFFRGLLAMMNHPIEALCFVGLLTTFLFIADRVSEK